MKGNYVISSVEGNVPMECCHIDLRCDTLFILRFFERHKFIKKHAFHSLLPGLSLSHWHADFARRCVCYGASAEPVCAWSHLSLSFVSHVPWTLLAPLSGQRKTSRSQLSQIDCRRILVVDQVTSTHKLDMDHFVYSLFCIFFRA